MTSTITYEEYEAARQASAILASESTCPWSIDQDAWLAVKKLVCSESSGILVFVDDYGPFLPHIGSSSSVVDCRLARRHTAKLVQPEASLEFRKVMALPVVEQMQELLAALSLNKSQLARILRVTRPTTYDWFNGKEPNAANMQRFHALLRILARASVSGVNPLNARFVRQPIDLDAPSLMDLLEEEQIDEERVLHAIEQVRELGESASHRRKTREDRLRALGFDDPSDEQRRKQLARNVALQDWPKQ